MSRCLLLTLAWTLLAGTVLQAAEPSQGKIRLGIIGVDTSHAVAFPKIFNNPNAEGDIAACQVVAALPMKSPDLPSSYDRIEGYTETLRGMGIEIVDTMDALLSRVDAVLIEAVDGRPHLEQVRPVIAAGKPVFVDKPVTASLADAIELFELAASAGVPCFSSSAVRFGPEYQAIVRGETVGDVVGCVTWSPCSIDATHPDLFWYGIHGVEGLFTLMGPGCKTVSRTHTDGTDVVTGVWSDGRVGTFRGLRSGKTAIGAIAFGTKGITTIDRFAGYQPLVAEIATFFKTGKPPVDPQETLEIVAFMEAADESKRLGGAPVSLESMFERARQKLAQRKQ